MRRLLPLLFALLLWSTPATAAVTVDTSSGIGGAGTVFGGFTVTSGTFTVAANTNRACLIGIGTYVNIWADSFTISCAGVAATAIANTQVFSTLGADEGTKLWGNVAPTTGASKSCTATWSTSTTYGTIGCIIAFNVNQTTPFTNGVNTAAASPASLAVTSAVGNLTMTAAMDDQGGSS